MTNKEFQHYYSTTTKAKKYPKLCQTTLLRALMPKPMCQQPMPNTL